MRATITKCSLILVLLALPVANAIAQPPTPEATPIPSETGPISVGPFALSDLVGLATLAGIIIVGFLSAYTARVLGPMQRREVELLERELECAEREKESLANVLREQKAYLEMQLRDAQAKANISPDLTPPSEPVALQPKDRQILQEILGRLERIETVSIATGTETLRPEPWTYILEGSVHYHNQQYEQAIDKFNKALELKPDDPEVLVSRGTANGRLGRHDRAIEDFSRALELKPDYPNPRYNMACVYSLMNKPDEALKWLEEAIASDRKFLEMAKTDSDFDNIRDDPRFKELVGE